MTAAADVLGARMLAVLALAFAMLDVRVQALQPGHGEHLSWRDAFGQPTAQAMTLADVLQDAGSYGLASLDYAAPRWPERWFAHAPIADAVRHADDVAFTRAVRRFLSDLHRGRVDPARLGVEVRPAPAVPLAAEAAALAQAPDPLVRVAALEPPYAGYRRLRAMLQRYRVLGRLWDAPALGPLPARVLEPGMRYADATVLAHWLVHVGDLDDAGSVLEADVYTPALAQAVATFQARHGLLVDGRLGPRTFAALRTPLRTRIRQIELALERWRWAPARGARTPVIVNVPEFRLRAIEPGGRIGLQSNVVVGRALGRRTPLIAGQLQTIVFRPYWDVPLSIVRRDLVPRALKDPGYLRDHGFEIDGRADVELTADIVAALRRGTARLRQRPGDGNSLGRVKFLFPNGHAVYLHDTPARELFARDRRDFSSGCVRVERADALAEWVLRSDPRWPASRVQAALAGAEGDDVAVTVDPPVPVLLLYVTAVAPEHGNVQFFDDVYGLDAALERALAERAGDGP